MISHDNPYTFPDPAFAHSKWAHALRLFIMSSTIVVVSIAALFYSLGYQFNWITWSIQKTGLISLGTNIKNLQATVSIDNKVVANEFPYRTGPLFPDVYTISITKPGFQSWDRTVRVSANRVASFKSIVLIKSVPILIPVDLDKELALNRYKKDDRDIEITENELRVNGVFVTRSSEDIVTAEWYTDRDHVVYQAGKSLWLAELDGQHTQKLFESPIMEPLVFCFIENGKILLYKDSTGTKALELF